MCYIESKVVREQKKMIETNIALEYQDLRYQNEGE